MSDAGVDALLADSVNNRVKIAVGNAGQVYLAIVSSATGNLAGLFRSPNGLAPWTQLDTPTTTESGGVQGIHPRTIRFTHRPSAA